MAKHEFKLKGRELVEMESAELQKMLAKHSLNLFNAKMSLRTHKTRDTSVIWKTRKLIAKILTAQTEKKAQRAGIVQGVEA